MRIWHKDLIQVLPRQQLLGQWRELCAIAKSIAEDGTPNHVLVNKVIEYPMDHLFHYADIVYVDMFRRGYHPDWARFYNTIKFGLDKHYHTITDDEIFARWHNDRYLAQCLANLQEKYDCGAIPAEEWKKITDRYPEWK